MNGSTASWRVLDTFLLRRAGFPFSLIDGLGPGHSAQTAADYLRARARSEESRRVLLGEIVPEAVTAARAAQDRTALRALSRLRTSVGHRSPRQTPVPAGYPRLEQSLDGWRAAMAETRRLSALLAEHRDADQAEGGAALRKLSGDPQVEEAIFLLSPSFWAAVRRRRDSGGFGSTAAERAHDRKLYAFVQRLAAKNETTSFFGPVTYGSFGPVTEPEWGPSLTRGYVSRHARVSFWAAVELARAATRSAAVRHRVPARRLPAVTVSGDSARLPGLEPVLLSDSQTRVLDFLTRSRPETDLTASGIAARTGISPAETEAALRALETRALVSRRLEPSSTTDDPLGEVTARLSRIEGCADYRASCDRLAELTRQWAQAKLPERERVQHEAEQLFEAVTGRAATRQAGRTYADRSIMFEDCVGDGQPLVLPDGWRRRIAAQLEPVLDLGLAVGEATRSAHRDLGAEILTARGGALPFLTFVEVMALAVAEGRLEPRLAAARAIAGRYARLVEAAASGLPPGMTGTDRVVLEPAAVGAVAERPATGAFVSPDVLLTGDGSGPIVLGELHPYVFAWGLQGAYCPDPAGLSDEMAAIADVWGGRDLLATVLHRRRHKGLLSSAFPGTFIEVTGDAGEGSRRVSVSGLVAEQGPDGPRLTGPSGELRLYVGEDDHPHLRVFAPAQVEVPQITLGQRTPRILVGEVVVQRARWNPDAGTRAEISAADDDQLIAVVAAFRQRERAPRYVFVSSPAEVKPFLIDLESVFGAEHLQRLARLGPVSMTEMLPGPDELWVRREGRGYTSEVRLSMARGTR
jgi:hypothetical protein